MLKGQLDKVMVSTPRLEAHNICGQVKDGLKMKGQFKGPELKQDTWGMKAMSGSMKSMSGSSSMKGRMH